MMIKKFLTFIFNPKIINRSHISKRAKVSFGVNLRHVTIDDYSYIGSYARICECQIGKFCSIAGNCYIGGGSHSLEFVSTSPVFCKGKNIFGKNIGNLNFNPYKSTIIGNDVWIGEGVRIKSGVKIGDGSVIGMGSVVTHDVPPYEIWAGNPAKFIRKRFDDDTASKLLEIKWWAWEESKIKHYADVFDSPQKLFDDIKKL